MLRRQRWRVSSTNIRWRPSSIRDGRAAARARAAPGSAPFLVLDDPGGEPLDRLLGKRMEVGAFLRLAVGIAQAIGGVHDAGLIHKDIKRATSWWRPRAVRFDSPGSALPPACGGNVRRRHRRR